MNFFKGTGDIAQGMMNMMNNNNWSASNQKESKLRKNLESCTYPDETKYMIEKAVKQVFHVYPFFDADILMFTENGFQRRFVELKGILEVDIKGRTCKVDYNMMLGGDFPRSAPFIRIINRNPDYRVDPFYAPLQSKSDKSSFILNEKLNAWKNWHPSSSLVNIIIQSYDVIKTRFPFAKPQDHSGGPGAPGGNAWDKFYNKPNSNNSPGGVGFNNPGQNNWGGNQGGTNNWGQAANWGANNSWGNQNQWQHPSKGGMGGIMGGGGMVPGGGSNPTATIASGQKLVGRQKQTVGSFKNYYLNLIQKTQSLDILKQSLESQQSQLRRQNFEMTSFLNSNQKSSIPDLTSIVKPADELSNQILDLQSSIKAREDCLLLLENHFNEEQIKLEDFMKQMRKIEEARFEEKILLQKCLSHAH